MIIFSITIFIVSQEWKRKGVTIYFYPEVFLEVWLICNFRYINFKISLNKILIFLKNQCNFPKTDEGKLFLPHFMRVSHFDTSWKHKTSGCIERKHLPEVGQHYSSPTEIYLFKVNNRNTRRMCGICSKLTIKTPEGRHWRSSSVFIVNFELISHIVLAFFCWLWTIKFRL